MSSASRPTSPSAPNGSGETSHVVGFHQDVTEQREYREGIERQFDEFSDVLAEELKEPLTTALAHLSADADEPGGESDGGHDADGVGAARAHLERAERLVEDLSTLHSFEVEPREVSEATRVGDAAEE